MLHADTQDPGQVYGLHPTRLHPVPSDKFVPPLPVGYVAINGATSILTTLNAQLGDVGNIVDLPNHFSILLGSDAVSKKILVFRRSGTPNLNEFHTMDYDGTGLLALGVSDTEIVANEPGKARWIVEGGVTRVYYTTAVPNAGKVKWFDYIALTAPVTAYTPGTHAWDLDIDYATNRLFVARRESGISVGTIDFGQDALQDVSSFFSDGTDVQRVAVDNKNGRLYFSETGTDNVYRLDLATGGAKVLFSNDSRGSISGYVLDTDPDAGNVITQIDGIVVPSAEEIVMYDKDAAILFRSVGDFGAHRGFTRLN